MILDNHYNHRDEKRLCRVQVSSTVDGKTTDYRYDGAGRLVQEGDKTYQYGYLDKILNVLENGETIAGFDYHMNGQIASSVTKDGTENFLWDGLALIHRGGTNYINEPAVTGGNPILADGNVLFNDMLGTTLGVKSGDQFNRIAMTAFGESGDPSAFFTGKPAVDELGYAFLFRNYRADQGKWQSQDPLGYPDGWNNFTYVNNSVTMQFDYLGASSYSITICVDGGPGGGSSSGNSSASNYGHGWVSLKYTDDNGVTTVMTRGFYPQTTPGVGAIWGNTYPGELRNDSNRPNGYVTMAYTITQGGYNQALDTIYLWQTNTPNWELSNNCMNFMLTVLYASNANHNLDISQWWTNGWLDPSKAFTWLKNNGGTIKE